MEDTDHEALIAYAMFEQAMRASRDEARALRLFATYELEEEEAS